MTTDAWAALSAEVVEALTDWKPYLLRAIREIVGLDSSHNESIEAAGIDILGDEPSANFPFKPNWMLFDLGQKIAGNYAARYFKTLLDSCNLFLDALAKVPESDEAAEKLVGEAWAFYNQYPHLQGR